MKKILFISLMLIITLTLAACNQTATENAGEDKKPISMEGDGIYQVDTKESTVFWEAYKLVGGHNGGIELASGEVEFSGGHLKTGHFDIDMTSITDADIENESMRQNFLNHLKADDFFSVQDYPIARLDLAKVTPISEEGFNYEIKGDLTIKDKTESITFKAQVEVEDNITKAKAEILVDRTLYGITFRSGKFFEDLGDTLIKDEFKLELDLIAKKSQI